MARYRTINVDLNRQYRNDLNANFAQIEQDIIGQENFTVEMKNSLLTELARIEQDSIDRDNTLAKQNLEVLLQSIEDAKTNANTAASNANTKATHAQTQGDYAKSQGDYAKLQGEYAQTKGDYADEKAILADQAAGNANLEAGNLSQLKVDVVTATQNANTATDSASTATTNANDSATYATTQGDYAKTQGIYANEKGLLAHNEASNLSQLKADAQTATTNANTAASNANTEASNLSTLKSEVQTATTNANTATSNAQTQANHAKTQGDFAKNQGNYAKQQGDIIQDILDQGTVASVNEQTGAVVLGAEDVGAIPSADKGVANGVAKLNASGKVVDASGNEVEGKVKSVNSIEPDGNGNITIDIPEPDLSSYATKQELQNKANTSHTHTIAQVNGLQTEIDNLKSSVSDGKNSVEVAIEGKGGTVADTNNPPSFADLVNGVNGIPQAQNSPITIGAITPNTSKKNFAEGYYKAFSVLGDTDLKPENIKNGMNLFGVVGTLQEGKKWANGLEWMDTSTTPYIYLEFVPTLIAFFNLWDAGLYSDYHFGTLRNGNIYGSSSSRIDVVNYSTYGNGVRFQLKRGSSLTDIAWVAYE